MERQFKCLDGGLKNTDRKKTTSAMIAKVISHDISSGLFEKLKIEPHKIDDILNFYKTKYGIEYKWYGSSYYKVLGKVIFNGVEIEDADATTFSCIPPDNLYAVDKNTVYFAGKRLHGIDPQKFKSSSHFFGNYLMYYDGLLYSGHLVPGIKVDKISYVGKVQDGSVNGKTYIKDGNTVYVGNFQYYENNIIKTSEHVISDGDIVQGVDIDTFSYYGSGYYKDRNSTYFYSRVVGNSNYKVNSLNPDFFDLDTIKNKEKLFQFARQYPYVALEIILKYSNKYNVYYKKYNSNYINFDGIIYYKFKQLINIDSNSFHILTDDYSVDCNSLYFRGKPIDGVDPIEFKKTYKKVGGYFVFNGGVIFDNKLLKGFEVTTTNTIQSSENVFYSNGKTFIVDKGKLYILDFYIFNNYIKSSKYLLYKGKRVVISKNDNKLDIDSLRIGYYEIAKDKYGYIREGRRTPEHISWADSSLNIG